MTHEQARELLFQQPSVTWRACGEGRKLWVHDGAGRDVEAFDGIDIYDCIEQYARKHERSKTLPPRSEMPTLADNYTAVRGKP